MPSRDAKNVDADVTPYERIERLEKLTDEMGRKINETRDRLIGAFPAGDLEGHRHYHEMMMEAGRDRKKLITAVKEKTVAGLVWALMLGVGIACWKYFMSLLALMVGKGGG